MAKLTVEVVTGERRIYDGTDVDEVVARGVEGEFGILPHHTAFVSPLAHGEVRIKKGSQEESLIVFGGFLEVKDDHVIVLADAAERSDDIDVQRAQEARRRAQETLANRGSEEDAQAAEAALARADVRIRLGGRRRHAGQSADT